MSARARLAGALGLAAGLLAPATAAAAEWRVGAPGLPSLGAAVARAAPGDAIRLPAGRYREHLVLDRPLSIVGEPGAVLDGEGKGDVLRVEAPGCKLSGLTVANSGAEILGDTAGIRVLADRCELRDLRIENCLFGVSLVNSHGHRLERLTIRGTDKLPRGDRGDGVRLHNATGNALVDLDIQDTRDGIYFNGSGQNTVRGNRISHVRYGLHYMYSDDNAFSRNRFTDTEAGAALMFSRRITLERNVFTGNRGYRAYALLVKDCEESLIRHNLLADNRTGLFLDGAIGLTIEGNRITGNDVGFEVRASSELNRISGNDVVGNTVEVALPTGCETNTWLGNAWSGYAGYDLDGDGTGDVPHQAGDLFSATAEALPPARLFLLGPAIEALAFAERTVPVLRPPQIADPAPLARPPALPEVPRAEGGSAGGPAFGASALGLLGLGLLPLALLRKTDRP